MDQFPQHLGTYENTDVYIHDSRFGFVIKWGEKYYTIKEDDVISMSISKAIEVIEEKERENIKIFHIQNKKRLYLAMAGY